MPSSPSIQLHFLGGAGTVTGSKTLLKTDTFKVLIDCGLFQGLKDLRNLNRQALPLNHAEVDAILLTHAHLDHSGYLPVLVKQGFKGAIHCTAATRDLAEIILLDSAKIQEEDAERANRYNYSRHDPAIPLYTEADVRRTMQLFVTHAYHEWVILHEHIKFEFLNNGHILGSAMAHVHVYGQKIVFSGDMGQHTPMLLYPASKIKEVDYLIMESTYGDRLHARGDVKKALLEVIEDTFSRGGILMIPSFAVERTQEILYLLYQLRSENLLPRLPVYLDSPMGVHATKVYENYPQLQNISRFELSRMYEEVKFIDDSQVSKAICLDKRPKIVLAGSGMVEGGRILHYLNNHMGNPKNTLLFVGYQGEGTRGRALLSGEKEIKFYGEYHPVKCEVRSLPDLSAHGDQQDLMDWMSEIRTAPKAVFLNHGERHQTEALRVKIEHTLRWNVRIPQMHQEFNLKEFE
jgi:metallo-beta-lactamase family protein